MTEREQPSSNIRGSDCGGNNGTKSERSENSNVVRAIREAEDEENPEEVEENPGVEMAPGNLALTDQFTTMLVSLPGNMIKIHRGALFTILNIIRPIPV